jgi:hypothetical protein
LSTAGPKRNPTSWSPDAGSAQCCPGWRAAGADPGRFDLAPWHEPRGSGGNGRRHRRDAGLYLGDIYANEPIYFGLASGLVVFVVGSLASKPADPAVLAEWDRRSRGQEAEPVPTPVS